MNRAFRRDPLLRPRAELLPQKALRWKRAEDPTIFPVIWEMRAVRIISDLLQMNGGIFPVKMKCVLLARRTDHTT